MQNNQDLFNKIYSIENLNTAFEKAKKGKGRKQSIIRFEENLEDELLLLRTELLLKSYSPKKPCNFVVRDPKTRKISAPSFRDRIMHHALCNIIRPIFEKGFIYDTYANRVGKGTLAAIKRFDCFKRKASRNDSAQCCILKADIKRYFENVDHKILMNIIKKRIKDKNVLWLINTILASHILSQRERERESTTK